jgi:hypothetical protein
MFLNLFQEVCCVKKSPYRCWCCSRAMPKSLLFGRGTILIVAFVLRWVTPIESWQGQAGKERRNVPTCSRTGRQMQVIRICQLSRPLFETPEL